MIRHALLSLLLAQDPAAAPPSSQRLYERPLVRPFEPPSDFGRETARGDPNAPAWRRPLILPISVDAYRHSYEVSPCDAEIAYNQGVTQAEIDHDARMGPLDGRWRVLAEDGASVMSLVLFDEGAGRRIEGPWSRRTRPGATGSLEPVEAVRHDIFGPVTVSLGEGGALTLNSAADGHWVGVMTRDGETAPVVVRRPL